MTDIGSRYLATHLFDAYYCPKNQATGCRECSNERDCWQEVHEAGLCWKLDEACIICGGDEDGDRGDYLYEQMKDRKMMEGE